MIWRLALPVGFALAAGLGAGLVQRRLRPRLAAIVLTAIAGLSALAVVWATSAVALGFLVNTPQLTDALGWCRGMFSAHDRVPLPAGVLATAALPLMAAGGWRSRRRRRRARAGHPPADGIEIVASEEPMAFAVPGRPGHVVVSVGMLRRLDHDEREVLFAHEQAHLQCRHHRYVALAATAAAVVPVLRPLCSQVRFATERWADEVAAAHVGDRRLVARAIARAALAQHDGVAAPLALAGFGVRARLEALLHDPTRSRPWAEVAAAGGVMALAGSVAASTVQLHHVVEYAVHVCPL